MDDPSDYKCWVGLRYRVDGPVGHLHVSFHSLLDFVTLIMNHDCEFSSSPACLQIFLQFCFLHLSQSQSIFSSPCENLSYVRLCIKSGYLHVDVFILNLRVGIGYS